MYSSVFDLKKNCEVPISVGKAFKNARNIFSDTSLDKTDKNGIFKAVEFDCQLIYYELLLTEILNLLEFIDSQQKNKELWKDLDETYEIFYELAEKFPVNNNGAGMVPETIRNSIIHVRYLLDDGKIHFYDGKNETQIKYRFTTTIPQLEEIRDCIFEYVDDYLSQKKLQLD